MDNSHLLSVLMPVFNSEQFVEEAIESILNQSFNDFEFLILDDASTDKSFKIIKDFEKKVPRIKVFQNEKNLGVVGSRNKLINLSKGKYIAWLDSDDIAFENRFEEQIKFLEQHPEIGMVGAYPVIIDENGKTTGKWWFETDPQKLKIELFFHSPFLSSSVMIRRTCLPQNFYDSRFPVAEDFNLYSKISERFDVANIPKFLVNYRINSKGLSKSNTEKMEQLSMAIENIEFDKIEKLLNN